PGGVPAAPCPSQSRLYHRTSLGGGDDGCYLEIHEILPVVDPLVQQRAVSTLHDLKTTLEILCHPAVDVPQSLRCQSPAIVETAIDRNGIATAKVFENHVEHRDSGLGRTA